MKKSILLMLPLALTIGSCSCSSNLDKGSIFNENFMNNNFGNEYAEPTYEEKLNEKSDLALGENIANVTADDGVLTVTTNDAHVGLFQLALKQYVVPVAAHENLGVADAGERQYYWYIDKTEDEKFVLTANDDTGAEVYKAEVESAAVTFHADGTPINYTDRQDKEVFSVHLYDDTNLIGKYYTYNDDTSVKESGDFYEYAASHRYDRLYRQYGHRELGLSVAQNGRYSFYNVNDKKYVSSFYFDAPAYQYTAGDWMVFQRMIELEERATEYDFYSNAKKYDLETYRINYTTGAREDIDTKIMIFDHQFQLEKKELYDDSKDNKVIRYFYQEDCYFINDNRTVEPIQRALILNDKMEQVADLSDVEFAGLTKHGDKYVSLDGFVYDANMHEVAYIEDLDDPEYDLHIVKSLGDKYGLVNSKGEVLLTPTALDITKVLESGKEATYMVTTEDAFDLYKLSEKEELTKIASFAKETYVGIMPANPLVSYATIVDVDNKAHVLNLKTGEVTDAPEITDPVVATTTASFLQDTINLAAVILKGESGYYMLNQQVNYTWKLA